MCVRLCQPIKGKLRLSQPMKPKRKHPCDDMCGKLQAICPFEQVVLSAASDWNSCEQFQSITRSRSCLAGLLPILLGGITKYTIQSICHILILLLLLICHQHFIMSSLYDYDHYKRRKYNNNINNY